MTLKIRTIISTLSIAFLAITPLAFAGVANAQGAQSLEPGGSPNVTGSLEQGTCLSTDDCSNAPTATNESVNSTVALVINIFSWIVGVISVIMIIWGGFKYITSGGDSNNVTAAKNTILYAIIGLVIVALAQVIVRFVIGTATGTGI
jgi:hypothetical protein